MTWNFTDVPPGVDLDVPIMPHRDEADMAIYGIDPAWLHEVLVAWEVASGFASGAKVAMPERPTADWMNGIYGLARGIKNGQGHFYAAAPSAYFVAFPDGISFGNVPDDVAVGDPVRREDVSRVYDFMENAKAVGRELPFTVSFTPTVADSDTEGAGTMPMPVEFPVAYDWDWYYSQGDYQDTFGYYRRTTSSFSVSVSLPGLRSAWFSSARLFLLTYAHTEPESYPANPSRYIPIGGAMSQVGDNLVVSATTSGVELRNAFGIVERGYKDGLHEEGGILSGRYRCTIQCPPSGAYGGIACFLTFASDYRV